MQAQTWDMSTHAVTGLVPRFTVAERLMLARTLAGMDQRQLAERVGIARNTISSYEDRNWPRARKVPFLRAIARVCGVDETWLLTGEEPVPGDGNGLTLPRLDSNQEPPD